MSPRVALIVLLFGIFASIIFYFVPNIDLWVSSQFYNPDHGFMLYDSKFVHITRILVNRSIFIVMLILSLGLLIRFFFENIPIPIQSKTCLYLILCFILGPGLIVNYGLKNHWGRPRPLQIIAFHGEKQFTSAWQISHQCTHNCSFVSGDAAGIFSLIAFVGISQRKKIITLTVLSLGAFIGIMRIGEGGHFLSDIVLSAVITYLISWILHYFLYKNTALLEPIVKLNLRQLLSNK